ncbi:M-phase phosphoprotein 8 isoform X3 [Vanacampus margaritifer]
MEGQVVKMEPMDSEQDEEENVYEVERIIDMRLEEGEVLYRVRWKGYCSDDDTWEPEGHLEDCREVLLAYKKATIEVKKEPEDRKPILPLPMKSDVFDADSESDSDKDQLTSDMPVVKKKKKKKKSREQQLEDDDEEPPRKEKKKKKKKDKWRDEVKPLPAPETDEDEEEKTTEMKKRLIESEDEDEVPSKKTKKEKSKDGKHRKERCGEEPKKKKSRKEYSIASSDDDLSEGLSDSSVKKEKPRWDEHRSKPKQKPDVKLKGIKDMIQDKKSKLKDSSLLKLKSLTSSKVREDAGPPSSDSSDSSGLHRKGKSKSQEAAPPAKPAPAASKPREDEVAKEDSKGSTNLFETFLLNCEAKDRAPRRPPLDKSASKPSKADVESDYEEYPESNGYSSEEWVQPDHRDTDFDSFSSPEECEDRGPRSQRRPTAVSTTKRAVAHRAQSDASHSEQNKECTSTSGSKKKDPQTSGWHEAGWQPNTFPFTAKPGPRGAAAVLNSTRPVDFLQLFITDKLLQHIADQTNLYARQSIQKQTESLPHRRSRAWKPVSVSELKTFFALQFVTGYINKPSIEMYWTRDEIETTPFFSQAMPRNRFELIWSFLHFNNNETHSSDDKLFKIRPVFNHIVQKFKELFQPGRNVCIDEGMMSFHGCLSFKVYNPQKTIKYGIKSYILCDSQTGYCFNMQPYVGTSCSLPDTVFNLLDRLPGKGYTLFMDNFHNSIGLCERLLAARTNVCGTLRKNRGEPSEITCLTNTGLGVGGKLVRHNTKVLVVAWQGKRLKRMVTTFHKDEMQTVDVWRKEPKKRVAFQKPVCVVDYNAAMNGVDKMDQNISYHPFTRKTLKWHKKFVAYLFQICMFNAYILHKTKNPGKCQHFLEFIQQVVRGWLFPQDLKEEEQEVEVVASIKTEGHEEARRNTRSPYHDPESRLDGNMAKHTLQYIPATSRKKRPSRRCRVCMRRGNRSETKMWCKACCVPLHAGECYTVYHTKRTIV